MQMKDDTKDHILCNSISTKCPGKENLEAESRWVIAWVLEWGGGWPVNEHKGPYWDNVMFYNWLVAMDTVLRKFSKNQQIVHLQQVNFMIHINSRAKIMGQ